MIQRRFSCLWNSLSSWSVQPTWQEHNPAKLKSRVLIVERRYAARKLKGVVAWHGGFSLWQTWGEEGLNWKRHEEHWKTRWKMRLNGSLCFRFFHVVSSYVFGFLAQLQRTATGFQKEAHWIVFLKQKQRICIFFDNRFLFVTCVCVSSFLDIEELVPTFDFSESNNALSLIPRKVQNQKACNVKSDILNHLPCDIGQNPQNQRVVIVIWFQHSIPESMNIWYRNVDTSSAGFRYWQKKLNPPDADQMFTAKKSTWKKHTLLGTNTSR